MFWNIFYSLCEKENKKPNQVAKELGISSGALTKWKSGTTPSAPILSRLADYFDVSTDHLLGISKEKKPDSDTELSDYLETLRTNPEMRIMFDLCRSASKEDLVAAVALIREYMGK